MIKKILLALVVIVLLVVVGVPAFMYGVYPKMRPAPQMTAPKTPEAIERGRYLADALTGCIACHSPIDETRPGDFPQAGLEFAGRIWPEGSGFPGKIVAPNLTPDPETGIGQWTDGEVVRAMREGVSRDGRPLFPLMNYPGYRDLTDDDALAIVAYLRRQKPVRRDNGRTELDFPVGMMIRTVPQPLEGPPPGIPAAGIERGRVMLKLMLCGECHTPSDKAPRSRGRNWPAAPSSRDRGASSTPPTSPRILRLALAPSATTISSACSGKARTARGASSGSCPGASRRTSPTPTSTP